MVSDHSKDQGSSCWLEIEYGQSRSAGYHGSLRSRRYRAPIFRSGALLIEALKTDRHQERQRSEELLCRSAYLTSFCAKASMVVGPWNFSVPELPKWIQPELKLFTISI